MEKSEKQNIKTNFILSTLTPVNFLLSLLIVFHHGFTVDVSYIGDYSPGAYGVATSLQRFMYNLSECAVPTFYFLSAYLFYRTFDGTWNNYVEKIKRRFYSLVVPYIIFCTLGYFKHILNVGGGTILGYIHSLIICDTMPLWFIRELIILSLLAPLIYVVLKNKYVSLVVAIASIALVSLGIIPYRCFAYWLPVYMMGASLNKLPIKKLESIFERRYVTQALGLLLLTHMIWSWYLPNGILRQDMNWIQNFEFIAFRIVTPIVWLFIMWIVSRMNIKDREWMKYSFFVFCIHFPVITLLGIIYDKFISFDNEIIKWIYIIILTYVISVTLGMLLKRFTPKLWKVLNGRR